MIDSCRVLRVQSSAGSTKLRRVLLLLGVRGRRQVGAVHSTCMEQQVHERHLPRQRWGTRARQEERPWRRQPHFRWSANTVLRLPASKWLTDLSITEMCPSAAVLKHSITLHNDFVRLCDALTWPQYSRYMFLLFKYRSSVITSLSHSPWTMSFSFRPALTVMLKP